MTERNRRTYALNGSADPKSGRPDGGLRFLDTRRTGGPASAEGLSQAFWRLWLENRSYLQQLAMRWMSGNAADADDLLSRAAIKAHDRYLRDAHKIKSPRSWCARVLHNLCMDEHRKRSAHNRFVDKLHPEQANRIAASGSEVRDPERQLALDGSFDTAIDVIMKMPKRLRHPFVLRFVYQYTNQEIARHLDLTEVNVRKRIQLGRGIMREHLEPL